MSRAQGLLPWLFLLCAVADWLALRRGLVAHPPWVLAAIVAGSALAFLLRLVMVALAVAMGRRRPGPAAAESLLLTGILLALGGGTANWLLSLQGFVVLLEGEAVPLHRGSHLQRFTGGPLSRPEELQVALRLLELELVPSGGGSFFPRSQLAVSHGDGPADRIEVSPEEEGRSGSLRFHQGAFGFAPRIVITHDGRTVFDRVVPFTSRRVGQSGVAFEGSFTIAREELTVDGTVDLQSLDEGMRGHATLRVAVQHGTDRRLLGQGTLAPGHFADIKEGYRVGFAGLEKWSEIDLSRRSYGRAIQLGGLMALVGLVALPLATWIGR